MENKEKSLAITPKQNAIQALAARLKVDEKELQKTLKSTVLKAKVGNDYREPTDAEFMMLAIVANTYGLNPILKELYAFPNKTGGIVPIVSVDGWISLVNRNKDFDGVELIENKNETDKLVSVTAKFYLKSKSHPVIVTEYLSECRRNNDTWSTWPVRMLRHKAYIQGARLAFGFSGIYDEDEAQRIIDSEATEITKDREMPKMINEKTEPEKPKETPKQPPAPEPETPSEKSEYIQVQEAINITENDTTFDMEGSYQSYTERKTKTGKTIYDAVIADLFEEENKISVAVWKKPDFKVNDEVVIKEVKVYNPQGQAYYSAKEITKK